VTHIIKAWKLCGAHKENVMCLLDNRDHSDFAQLRDANVKRGVDVGETILSLFLGILNSGMGFIDALQPL